MYYGCLHTGADLLTLTRDELIQICGLADGIRLNNALQVKTVRPRLTIYVNIPPESGNSQCHCNMYMYVNLCYLGNIGTLFHLRYIVVRFLCFAER